MPFSGSNFELHLLDIRRVNLKRGEHQIRVGLIVVLYSIFLAYFVLDAQNINRLVTLEKYSVNGPLRSDCEIVSSL